MIFRVEVLVRVCPTATYFEVLRLYDIIEQEYSSSGFMFWNVDERKLLQPVLIGQQCCIKSDTNRQCGTAVTPTSMPTASKVFSVNSSREAFVVKHFNHPTASRSPPL